MVGAQPGTGERAALEALRDAARALLALDSAAVDSGAVDSGAVDSGAVDSGAGLVRAEALRLYRSYAERFGPLNRGELREGRVDPQTGRPGLRWHRPSLDGFRTDPDYHLVMALEIYDQATGEAHAAPILHRRVHGSRVVVGEVATPFEALAVLRAEGVVDLERAAELLSLSGAAAAEQALDGLVFRDPDTAGAWVTAMDYLAGDVRAKLRAAREACGADPSYERNVAALERVVPADLGPLEIDVSLGSPILEAGDVEAFVHDVLGGRVRAWHLPSAAWWKIVPTGRIPRTVYDTARMGAYDILAAGLNGRVPTVTDSLAGPVPGRRVRRRNAEAGLAAQDRLSALQQRFRTWVWEDASRAERLCAEHNRRFNSYVAPPDLGAGLTFPGLADGIELWPWQREVIARIVSSPATLCAHAVGAGKTRSMIGAAMTARRLGLAAKPLVAVPAHLVEQVAREARQAYPSGRFLVLGEQRVGEQTIGRALAARCATGDWDAVIVSHGTLGSLPVAPATERADLAVRISRTEAEMAAGMGGRHGRSLLGRRLSAFHERADRLARTDAPGVTFETVGVDLLLVDEAHYFKRLPITSRREGISLGSSRRAADLELKARTLRARRGGLPSLALFTGTPWSNTVAETFVWQTLVQPDVLRAAGIEHFDAWAAVFVEYDTVVEVTPDSAGIRVAQRPSKVRNLPELVRMLSRSALVLPPADLGLEQPGRLDDTVVCTAGPKQRQYLRGLAVRADKIHRERVRGAPGEDNMLALCGDGRRAALDPRLVGIDEASTKVGAVADRVAQIHHRCADVSFPGSDERGAFQIVFCDQGAPGAYGPQTYGRLRIALAERGVPADRVRWVHDARTPAARTALFADCRAGRVSVLIGSTDTLGTGSNVQTRLRAIHHADAPWRPSDVEQREGRALRPGNLNAEVEIVRYVTRGSFDGYVWQTLERKARFIEDLRRGDAVDRVTDDLGETVLSYAEVKALATGNPLLLEHARSAADLARLRVLDAVSKQTLTAARASITAAEREHYRCRQRGRMLASAAARLDDVPHGRGDGDAVAAAAEMLRERLRRPDPAASTAPIRAPWCGLGVELIPAGGWRAVRPADVAVRVTLAHRAVDELTLASSAVRRSTSAVTTALEGWTERLPELIEQAAVDADAAAADAERASRLMATHRPEHADALHEAQARFDLITTALEASVDDRPFDPYAEDDDLYGDGGSDGEHAA